MGALAEIKSNVYLRMRDYRQETPAVVAVIFSIFN